MLIHKTLESHEYIPTHTETHRFRIIGLTSIRWSKMHLWHIIVMATTGPWWNMIYLKTNPDYQIMSCIVSYCSEKTHGILDRLNCVILRLVIKSLFLFTMNFSFSFLWDLNGKIKSYKACWRMSSVSFFREDN